MAINKEMLAMLLGQKKKKKGLFATPPTALEYKELYKTDPRLLYGRGLMKSAAGRTPKNVGEGISKAADAIFGALAMREGLEDVREKERIAKEKLLEERTKSLEQIKSANLASLGLPEWKDPDTEKILIPASKGRPASIEQLRSYGDELTLAGQAYLGNLVQEERKQKDQFSKIKYKTELTGELEDRKHANRIDLETLKNALNLSKDQSNAATRYYWDLKRYKKKSDLEMQKAMLTNFGIKISYDSRGVIKFTPIKAIQKFINKKNAKLVWITNSKTKLDEAHKWVGGKLEKVLNEQNEPIAKVGEKIFWTVKKTDKKGNQLLISSRGDLKWEKPPGVWSEPYLLGNKMVIKNLTNNNIKDVVAPQLRYGEVTYDAFGNAWQKNSLTGEQVLKKKAEKQSAMFSKEMKNELLLLQKQGLAKRKPNGDWSTETQNLAIDRVQETLNAKDLKKSLSKIVQEQMVIDGIDFKKVDIKTKEGRKQIADAADRAFQRKFSLAMATSAGKAMYANKLKAQAGLNVINRLIQLTKKYNGMFPDKGSLGTRTWRAFELQMNSLFQNKPDWVIYQKLVQTTLPRIVRSLGESGVLATKDIDRAYKGFPRTFPVTDTKEVAIGSLEMLKKVIVDGLAAGKGAAGSLVLGQGERVYIRTTTSGNNNEKPLSTSQKLKIEQDKRNKK